jgi:anti-sigma factor ChrR (cupin superfamily)
METAAEDLLPLIVHNLFSEAELDRQEWEPFHQGIEIRRIYGGAPAAASAALLRYQPGAQLPRHWHQGYEHILVLRGSQIDDNGEHTAGTLLIHPPGTSHAVRSPGGCIVLAMWEKPVHLAEIYSQNEPAGVK